MVWGKQITIHEQGYMAGSTMTSRRIEGDKNRRVCKKEHFCKSVMFPCFTSWMENEIFPACIGPRQRRTWLESGHNRD